MNDLNHDLESRLTFSMFNKSTIYNNKDGLASSYITDVAEDKNGYLWVSTAKGLSRFDGSNFTNFEHYYNDSSKVNVKFGFINKIIFNKLKDKIYFASSQGIYSSKVDDVKFIRNGNLVLDENKGRINDFIIDDKENLWMVQDKLGIIFIDKATGKQHDYILHNKDSSDVSIPKNIRHIVKDPKDKNVLWVISSHGLVQFNIAKGNYQLFVPNISSDNVPNIMFQLIVFDEKIYIVSKSNGLIVFDKKLNQFSSLFDAETIRLNSGIRNLYIKNNTLIISTSSQMVLYDLISNEIVGYKLNDLNKGLISGVSFIDSKGLIWYCWNKGLLKYDPLTSQNIFLELEKKNQLQNPMLVREIVEWNNYYFVLGHNSKGLYKVNQDDYSTELIEIPDAILKDGFCRFRDIVEMDDGNFLILSNKLIIFNPRTNESYLCPLQLDHPGPSEQSIVKDYKNNYWINTRSAGLYKLNLNAKSLVNYRDAFNIYEEENYVWMNNLFIDSKNRLWMDNGTLSVMDLEDFSIQTLPKSKVIKSFRDVGNIVEDSKGKVWLTGYGEGLGQIEYDSFSNGIIEKSSKYYSKIFPFSDSIFYTLNRELGRVNINTMEATKINLELDDVQLDGPFIKGKNNDLIIGCDNGLFIYDLAKYEKNIEIPQPYIPQIYANGQLFYNASKLDDRSFNLSSDINNLIISISSKAFHYPNKITYEYKIEGDWIKLNKNNEINLSNLNSGEFTMELRACNNYEKCNINKVLYSFYISPVWYASDLACFIYLALFLALLFLFYRFQLSRKLALSESNRLKELDELKTNLYTNITHEFRTPLTVIQGMTNSLKSDIEDKNYKKAEVSLSMIQRNSHGLLRLVNEMLDLAKIESGSLELNKKQSNIIPFVKYLAESFNSLAAEKNINLTIYSELDSLNMDFDSVKFNSIISNLLANAIKFTNEHGKIIVHLNKEVESNKTFFIVKVKDDGIGISKPEIQNVFNRFYQVDSTISRKQEGTGIGLTLTKELVELMGGHIEASSQLGKGTTFTLHIPVTNNAEMIDDIKIDEANLIISSSLSSTWIEDRAVNNNDDLPVVVIIEDNKDVAYYLKSCLEGKYKILIAGNGLLGINMTLEHIPDIVITDVMMPEKDGFEVCSFIKSNELTDHIPIIMLTAKSTQKDRLTGLSLGADAYLAKPFVKAELLTRISQLILQRTKLINKFKNDQSKDVIHANESTQEFLFLEKAIKIIEDNMADSAFGSASLSQKLGLSESQIYRKLKATSDKSTAIFIRSIRLQKGKKLIHSSDKNISEIAYEIGFNDPAYFSRIFKEEFGFPPSELK